MPSGDGRVFYARMNGAAQNATKSRFLFRPFSLCCAVGKLRTNGARKSGEGEGVGCGLVDRLVVPPGHR